MSKLVLFITLFVILKSHDQSNLDPCTKQCSDDTYGKPCMHINDGDYTCAGYMLHGGCPSGYKDCSGNIETPCDYCDKDWPCLHDNNGDYSCKQTNAFDECYPGTTRCPFPDGKICDKECSEATKGKPCIHENFGDFTCHDYMKHGGCPAGTRDCSGEIQHPCEYCDDIYKCLHNDEPNFSCLKADKNGVCSAGTTDCEAANIDIHAGGKVPGKSSAVHAGCYDCDWSRPCLSDKYGVNICYQTDWKDECYPDMKRCDIPDSKVCDKECSKATKGKPCIHANKGDNTCHNYMKHGGCPAGTKDCSGNIDEPCEYCDNEYPCLHDNPFDLSCKKLKNGKCPPGTSLCDDVVNVYHGSHIPHNMDNENICDKYCAEGTSGPCKHKNDGDYSCANYMLHGGCPSGYQDCSGNIDTPCDYCDKDWPCLHDNYGDYSCKQTNAFDECYPGTTRCPFPDGKICDKECSEATKGKPCMHENFGDFTCHDYMKHGGCPAGTRDCSGEIEEPCEYCDNKYKCLHADEPNFSCLKPNKDTGKCHAGTIDCQVNYYHVGAYRSYPNNDPCSNCDRTNPCLKGNTCVPSDWKDECFDGSIRCAFEDGYACNKACKNGDDLPCININEGDNTCYNYMAHGGCPAGSKDCSGNIDYPCEYCDYDHPCLHDNYINGDYSCKETNPFDKCPAGTSRCPFDKGSVCDKECSEATKGKPCIHKNYGDFTCHDYMKHGGCPAGTKDCSGNFNDACDYCDYTHPCLHDNPFDFSCKELNPDNHECYPHTTLCPNAFNNPGHDYAFSNDYPAKIENELKNIENNSLHDKQIISLSVIMSTAVYVVGTLCLLSIFYGLYMIGCCGDKIKKSPKNGFTSININDPEDIN